MQHIRHDLRPPLPDAAPAVLQRPRAEILPALAALVKPEQYPAGPLVGSIGSAVCFGIPAALSGAGAFFLIRAGARAVRKRQTNGRAPEKEPEFVRETIASEASVVSAKTTQSTISISGWLRKSRTLLTFTAVNAIWPLLDEWARERNYAETQIGRDRRQYQNGGLI